MWKKFQDDTGWMKWKKTHKMETRVRKQSRKEKKNCPKKMVEVFARWMEKQTVVWPHNARCYSAIKTTQRCASILNARGYVEEASGKRLHNYMIPLRWHSVRPYHLMCTPEINTPSNLSTEISTNSHGSVYFSVSQHFSNMLRKNMKIRFLKNVLWSPAR